MRFQSLVPVLLVLLAYVARIQAIEDGYSPIGNINDPHVIEIANFAVTEFDKKSGATIKFEKIIKGESQIVHGTNYRLTFSAKIDSLTKVYEAIVYENKSTRKLTSFRLVAFGLVHA
ncbi:putative Cystatin domain-containing protein [Medicago truncatula]|uniref:Phloem filament protein PP1 n=1 Tax=Medicago truncatula TaxID=3880 RepID=A0A072UIK9_MEDTR|nr:cysteine proteinase inhibitor 5 [Medicago truncatula]KEH29507.1 phloem filament protein PP1 [Medicago truncatula]RHN59954.1 putative Cystatin domain-containing protein [Medicago truncatula]